MPRTATWSQDSLDDALAAHVEAQEIALNTAVAVSQLRMMLDAAWEDMSAAERTIYAQKIEIARLKANQADLVAAWTDAGPCPPAHEHAKRSLRAAWPTLFFAVQRLSRKDSQ